MTSDLLDFAAALQAPGTAPPPGLKAWNGSDPRPRFDVYRNTVLVSRVQALGDTLPVCRQAVGAECVDTLARAYLQVQAPTSPVLAEWGDGFADWLTGFAPAAPWPWLPALARLERARVRAFHAADATPLGSAALAAALADVAALPRSRLTLHPSCELVVADWNVVSLWAAHQADEAPTGLSVREQREAALVLRDDRAWQTSTASDDDSGVRVLPLPLAAAEFCAALQLGCSFADAVEATAAADDDDEEDRAAFDLPATLALLIRHGALVGWVASGDPA